MGTVIRASSLYSNGTKSSIELAVGAAKECIAKSGISMDDIGLLINIGVYRDENIMEPAIAPLIQKQLGMNIDPVLKGDIRIHTLSFDMNSGACGLITAVKVAEAALKNHAARYAVIVASDSHPSMKDHADFPFESVGSAMVLEHLENSDRGFQHYHFKTSGCGYSGFKSYTNLSDFGMTGKDNMSFEFENDFNEMIYEFTMESLHEYIISSSIDTNEISHLISTRQFEGFEEKILGSFRMKSSFRAAGFQKSNGDTHSSSLVMGYNHLADKNEIQEHDNILFVAAGAGLSTACSLYKA